MSRVQIHGHRGARARFPENTLPGFEYAIQLGVDAIELDLAVTKDDVLVVAHDPILEPPLYAGPEDRAVIREHTLARVREWTCGGERLPTLDEVLQLAPRGEFLFNLELKSFVEYPAFTPEPEKFSRMVLDKLREHRLERRAIVQSFDFRTLTAMRSLAPEIRLAALIEADARSFPAISASAAKSEIVAPHFPLVTPEKVAETHAAGIQVISWTANTPSDWDRLIVARVDGIITDDPAALMEYLASRDAAPAP